MARFVFLHGFTQSHHHWHAAAHLLREQVDPTGTLAFVDLPGHGLAADDTSGSIDDVGPRLTRLAGRGTYVGYSMGGFGTCRIMGSEPRLFAAAIPVAGVSASDVGELLRKPIWMFHAEDDAVVPVAGAREFAEQMKRNKQFKYTESKTGGHGVVGQVFNDPETHEWLFAQSLK